MTKERISVTVDEDLVNLLDQEHINTSGTVNKLLRKYFEGDSDEAQILDFRIEQVKSELEELRGRVDTKEQELANLKLRREEITEERKQVITEAAETLGPGNHSPKDRPVQYWASQAGVSETELIERVEQYHSNGVE